MIRRDSWGPLAALFLALVLVAGCGGGEAPEGAGTDQPCREEPLKAGDEAPDLQLTGPGGKEQTSLREVAEAQVVLVDVWATWCKPCLEAMPHLEELHNRYSADGFSVVGVMSDSNATRIGPEWVAERDLDYPMLYDDNSEGLICQWGQIIGYPTLFLLDADGVVLDVFGGTGDIRKIEERVAEVMEGGAPAEAGQAAAY
jgi:thiol-disulfide isomerase/thioredoxin